MARDPAEAAATPGIRRSPSGLKYLAPERAAAFLGLIRAGELLASRLDAELQREHQISLREFEVLLFLAVFASEGRLRMTELTRRAPLSQSRVSRLVTELERRGLVRRSPDDGDRRGIRVTITPAGIEKFSAAQETHLASLDRRLFSLLTALETRRLALITAKILEAQDP
jgi:DNA-binding MarR family transcriptional regulator